MSIAIAYCLMVMMNRNETDKEYYSKIKRALSYLYEDDPEEDGLTAMNNASRVVINYIHRYGKYVTGRKHPLL